jgi:hypothetical protein
MGSVKVAAFCGGFATALPGHFTSPSLAETEVKRARVNKDMAFENLPSVGEQCIVPYRMALDRRQTHMYCSTCGGAVALGLSYCNHCGARLNGSATGGAHRQAELFPESLIWAIVAVFVVGLGGTIGLMAVMKDARAFEAGQILGLSVMSFLAMLAVEAVLIYKLLSRGSEGKVSKKSKLKATTVRDLGPASDLALPEPSLSVTEHTTRTLAPVYRDRKEV